MSDLDLVAQQYENIADSIITLIEGQEDEEAKLGVIFSSAFYYDFAPFMRPYLGQAKHISERLGKGGYIIESYLSLGQYHNFSAHYDSAQVYFDQALALPYIDDHMAFKAELLEAKAVSRSRSDDIQAAINYFGASLEILESPDSRKAYIAQEGLEDLQKMSSIIHNNVGNLYKRVEEYDEAISHYDKAIELMYALDAERYAATVIMNMANAYVDLEQYEKALSEHERAKQLKIAHDASPRTVAFSNLNIGICLGRLERYEEALALIDTALATFLEVNNIKGLSYAYAEKGIIYARSGDNKRAIEYCDKSKNILDKETLVDYGNKVFDCLYKAHKASKNYNVALSAYEELTAIQDSALNAKNYRRIGQIESKMIYDKEQELAALRLANEQKSNKRNKWTFSILLLGLTMITGLIYKNYRDKKKSEILVREQNVKISQALSEKELLLREIHHRVKNNLQFISSLLRLQSDHVTDPTALGALQQGHDRVRSMALIHQDLYKEDNLTGVSTKSYFTKLITGLFKSNNIHDERIKFVLAIEDLNLDVDTIVPIGLITNELITNSLKYGFPDDREGDIHVDLKERDDAIHLIVSDNGVGMSSDQQEGLGSSFGYKLVRALVGQLEGEYAIEGDLGTSVNISISKYKKV